jgi:hypothetical protein
MNDDYLLYLNDLFDLDDMITDEDIVEEEEECPPQPQGTLLIAQLSLLE